MLPYKSLIEVNCMNMILADYLDKEISFLILISKQLENVKNELLNKKDTLSSIDYNYSIEKLTALYENNYSLILIIKNFKDNIMLLSKNDIVSIQDKNLMIERSKHHLVQIISTIKTN